MFQVLENAAGLSLPEGKLLEIQLEQLPGRPLPDPGEVEAAVEDVLGPP
jgi:hypothetical protein